MAGDALRGNLAIGNVRVDVNYMRRSPESGAFLRWKANSEIVSVAERFCASDQPASLGPQEVGWQRTSLTN